MRSIVMMRVGELLCKHGPWWRDERASEKRTADGRRNVSLSENHSPHALSVFEESSDSRVQVGERMAVRPIGPGAMDSQPDQTHDQSLS